MDVQGNEAAPAAAPIDFTPTLPEGTGDINPRDAGRMLSDAREKALKAATEQAEKPSQQQRDGSGRFAAAQTESALEGADAAAETPSGEDEGAEADLQPIAPPTSWTKAEKERFATLPRETQEYLSTRESEREAAIGKSQREAAERTKAVEAREQAAETARQQYEQAAQRTLEVLNREMAKDFGDIRSQADVDKLAAEDPFRFAQFQARMMGLQNMQAEVANAERQRAEQKKQTFEAWAKEQDNAFEKKFPVFADKDKAREIRDGFVSYLTEVVGVPKDALPQLSNEPLFRDAMYQHVLYDAYQWNAARENAKKAAAVQKPAPQRPGVAPARGQQFQEEIAAAQARLKDARGIEAVRAGAALLAASRKAAARR